MSASVGKRIAFGCLGVVTFGVAIVVTVGGALVAPVGMAASRVIQRRRQKVPTRRSSWLGAVIATTAVLLVVAGVLTSRAPAGSFAQIQRAADSAADDSRQHPPAWVQRVAPHRVSPAPAFGPKMRTAFALYGAIGGIVLMCAVLGAFAGTVGWVASLPLGYAITGQWSPGAVAPPAESPASESDNLLAP